jgi:hypothetical protein
MRTRRGARWYDPVCARQLAAGAGFQRWQKTESGVIMEANARTRGMYREDARRGRPISEVEARARLEWGHSPDRVIAHLVQRGESPPEAASLVSRLHADREESLQRRYACVAIASTGLFALGLVAIGLEPFSADRPSSSKNGGPLEFILHYSLAGIGIAACIAGIVAIIVAIGGVAYGGVSWLFLRRHRSRETIINRFSTIE